MARRSVRGSEYPVDWDAIAHGVKERAGWACARCKHPHDPSVGRTLTVHHADLDPANSRWWNLLPLCQACHLSIQARVNLRQAWMHEHSDWFRPYVAGFFAHLAAVRDDRAFAEHYTEQLIAFGRGRCTRAEIVNFARLFSAAEDLRALGDAPRLPAPASIEVDGGETSRPCGDVTEPST